MSVKTFSNICTPSNWCDETKKRNKFTSDGVFLYSPQYDCSSLTFLFLKFYFYFLSVKGFKIETLDTFT